jgi:hypothetical protein
MSSYDPMPVEAHLARGYCCEAYPQCKLCPYHGARQAPKVHRTRVKTNANLTLAALIKRAASGEKVVYYSHYSALVESVTIAENLTIIYKEKNV